MESMEGLAPSLFGVCGPVRKCAGRHFSRTAPLHRGKVYPHFFCEYLGPRTQNAGFSIGAYYPRRRAKRVGSGKSNVPESVSAASATKVPFSWRLLVTKPALACVGSHFSRDFIEFHTLAAWAPLFFNEVHGVALGSVGKYTTGAMAVQVVGKVMVAAWESARLQRGTPTLLIRKQADGLASLLGSFFLFCFSVAPTPGIAAICYIGTLGGHCFDYAAHIPNELEVGGTDTGKLGAAINTLCWTVNFLFAQVAAALKQRTGSYKAVLWLPIVFRLLSGFNYQLHASCDTAREQLRKHRGAAANPSTL